MKPTRWQGLKRFIIFRLFRSLPIGQQFDMVDKLETRALASAGKMLYFKVGDSVLYVPNHAHDDIHHPDTEVGFITRIADIPDAYFVKFPDSSTSKLCYKRNLRHDLKRGLHEDK